MMIMITMGMIIIIIIQGDHHEQLCGHEINKQTGLFSYLPSRAMGNVIMLFVMLLRCREILVE